MLSITVKNVIFFMITILASRADINEDAKVLETLDSIELDFALYNGSLALQPKPATSNFSSVAKDDPATSFQSWLQLALILVIVVLFFLTIICVIILVCLIRKRRKEEDEEDQKNADGDEKSAEPTVHKTILFPPEDAPELDEQPTQRDDTVHIVDCSRAAYINFAKDLKRRINKEERSNVESTKAIRCSPRELEIDRATEMRKLCQDVLTAANDSPGDNHIILSDNGKPTYVVKNTLFKLEGYGDRFKDNFINANMVVFQSNLRYILTKSPVLDGPESTVRKFYWMVKQSMCEFIINLCGWSSDPAFVKYFPLEANKEMQFAGLTVKCTSRIDEHDLITRKLAIRFAGETDHFVTHFQFDRWEEDLPPGTPGCAIIVKLMKKVRSSQRPVVVHCSDGVNRSGVIAFAEASYQSLCYKDVIPYAAVLLSLREQRARVITGAIQMAFSLALIAEYCAVTWEAGVAQSQGCKAKHFLMTVYEEYHWAEFKEVAEKREREKKEKSRKWRM